MRGVNKLVMEVRSDGKYFDKALLFLRPEQANAAQHDISDGAERLLRRITEQESRKRSKSPLIPAVLGCAAGTAVTFLSLLLCGAITF